ncbi:hypothetical protein ABH931_002872 [Streptacidiphilus sp. MAP12-33]
MCGSAAWTRATTGVPMALRAPDHPLVGGALSGVRMVRGEQRRPPRMGSSRSSPAPGGPV